MKKPAQKRPALEDEDDLNEIDASDDEEWVAVEFETYTPEPIGVPAIRALPDSDDEATAIEVQTRPHLEAEAIETNSLGDRLEVEPRLTSEVTNQVTSDVGLDLVSEAEVEEESAPRNEPAVQERDVLNESVPGTPESAMPGTLALNSPHSAQRDLPLTPLLERNSPLLERVSPLTPLVAANPVVSPAVSVQPANKPVQPTIAVRKAGRPTKAEATSRAENLRQRRAEAEEAFKIAGARRTTRVKKPPDRYGFSNNPTTGLAAVRN